MSITSPQSCTTVAPASASRRATLLDPVFADVLRIVPAAADVQVQWTRFLTTLPSGPYWNNRTSYLSSPGARTANQEASRPVATWRATSWIATERRHGRVWAAEALRCLLSRTRAEVPDTDIRVNRHRRMTTAWVVGRVSAADVWSRH